MSSPGQVRQNIAAAENALPGSLTKKELALVARVKKAFKKRLVIPCTGCGYCMPCPAGISIPECFEYFNQGHMYDDQAGSTENYTLYLGGVLDGIPSFASLCQECGQCEMLCPQGLPIRENLKKVAAYFGK
jgi:predicted aldo/keto reductase-like oxidoreductase